MGQYASPYKTAAWRSKRAHQLRIEPMCRYCAQHGRVTPATVADHITPHRWDMHLFWRGELQSLCAECHSTTKQREEINDVRVGCDADGLPIDPGHHWKQEV